MDILPFDRTLLSTGVMTQIMDETSQQQSKSEFAELKQIFKGPRIPADTDEEDSNESSAAAPDTSLYDIGVPNASPPQ